jgi:hypothetical protein
LSKGSLEIFKTKAVNCSGENLQVRQENGREESLEIYGTKVVNCSGGNLQARQENGREGSLEIYETKAVNCNDGNLQAWRRFCLGKKMQNCHPGAQMPILPRNFFSELSCHRQTDKRINIVRYTFHHPSISLILIIHFKWNMILSHSPIDFCHLV